MIKWCGLKGIWRTVKCLGLKFQYHLCPINANSLVTWNCAIMTQVWRNGNNMWGNQLPSFTLRGRLWLYRIAGVWPHRGAGLEKLLYLLRKWYTLQKRKMLYFPLGLFMEMGLHWTCVSILTGSTGPQETRSHNSWLNDLTFFFFTWTSLVSRNWQINFVYRIIPWSP